MFQTMSRICIQVVFFMATILVPALSMGAEPTPFRAVYNASYKGFPIGATGIRELKKTADGQYLLTARAHNFLGAIDQQTTFTLDKNDRIVPVEYQYHRTGIGPNRTTVLKFDWHNKRVTDGDTAKPWDLLLNPGTQDDLSYQLMLRNDLTRAWRQGEDSPKLTYDIADDGQLKEYSFAVEGKAIVKTPIGEFKTVKATRTDGNPNRVTNFWLAPAYNFMLIKFEQTEPDGSGFELLLRQAEFGGKKVSANEN